MCVFVYPYALDDVCVLAYTLDDVYMYRGLCQEGRTKRHASPSSCSAG